MFSWKESEVVNSTDTPEKAVLRGNYGKPSNQTIGKSKKGGNTWTIGCYRWVYHICMAYV
jgi:hypothetical protein